MHPIFVVLALVALTDTTSDSASSAQHDLLTVYRARATMLAGSNPPVYTRGDSVAWTTISLERSRTPALGAYAEHMSLGPLGALCPDTTGTGLYSSFRRLRVTISSSERMLWLTITDLTIGRADSRAVRAEYTVSPYLGDNMRDLWRALRRAPRVPGPDPAGSPIAWLSPTSFTWTDRADTLVFEQEADSVFRVTARARIR